MFVPCVCCGFLPCPTNLLAGYCFLSVLFRLYAVGNREGGGLQSHVLAVQDRCLQFAIVCKIYSNFTFAVSTNMKKTSVWIVNAGVVWKTQCVIFCMSGPKSLIWQHNKQMENIPLPLVQASWAQLITERSCWNNIRRIFQKWWTMLTSYSVAFQQHRI